MWTFGRIVHKQSADESDCLRVSIRLENFVPRNRIDMWKPVFLIIWVHLQDLFFGRRSKYFDDFDDLVDSTVSWEDRHCKHQLCDDTSYAPQVDRAVVLGVAEDQLWSPVISRTDIGNVWLTFDQLLGAAKVTQFNQMVISIYQDVLRLNVAVTDTETVNVGYCAQQLVCVDLHKNVGDVLFLFHVVLHDLVERVRNMVHYDVEVNFII